MNQRKITIIVVAIVLVIAIALPGEKFGVFAAWDGSPLFGYPSITTTDKIAPLGNHSLEWGWRLNECEITLTRVGDTVTITTDGNCFGIATLLMPVPAGKEASSCRIFRDGAPYPTPTFETNSIPTEIYTFLIPLFGFDGVYTTICD